MQLYSFIYILSTAVFELQWQSRVVATKTLWSTKQKILTIYLALYLESLLNPVIDACLAKYLFILIPERVNG